MKTTTGFELSTWLAPRPAVRTYAWGAATVVHGNEVRPGFEGVSTTLWMPFVGGAGPIQTGRSPSCVGCPFFGIDEHKQRYCAHPLWIEVFGCPQFEGDVRNGGFAADRDCPMIGRKSERAQRRYRQAEKARYIFWKYSEKSQYPYREGFEIPRSLWWV